MTGYLFPDNSKLTIQERKIFRDYYCSVCLSLKYVYGNLMRLFLSYDIAVLMMLSDYGLPMEDCGKCGRRVCHRKGKFIQPEFAVFADISVALLRKKIEDDLSDEYSLRKRLISVLCKPAFDKSKRRNPFLNDIIDENFDRYYRHESASENSNPDSARIALFYGRCIAETFQRILGLSDDRIRLLAGLSAWTLLVDALDDYDMDLRKGSFNVFGGNYRSRKEMLIAKRESIESIFCSLFAEIDDAFLQIYVGSRAGVVLENIVHSSIHVVTDTLLNEQKVKRQKLLKD